MTNQILTRIQHKHDVEANWRKATNFAPLAGELIIYDADENYEYPRFKVGIWDGESEKTADMLVSNLPFVTSEQLLEIGLSDYSIQQTDTGSLAGVKGFYWTEVLAWWPGDIPNQYYFAIHLKSVPYGDAGDTLPQDCRYGWRLSYG